MNQMPLFQPYSLTVSEVTRYLRQLLEGDELLQELWVEGEVCNLSRPASGHIYFSLKDSSAVLRCVIWRSTAQRLRCRLQDGEAYQVHGSIGVYEAGGQYQLYVDQVRSAGEGALYLEFMRLKARLEAEGLFDIERKRPIPAWPRCIGLVTSPSGAALQDMLNTLRRRFPLAEVILAPTAVQGEGAPEAIAHALEQINAIAHPDVILLARGGGSLEDLWAFNDERVAYAVAASPAPVITGIGHETDFTIADFVADLRAPTPTAAAELATPDKEDLRAELVERAAGLARGLGNVLFVHRWRLDGARGRLKTLSPLGQIQQKRLRLDDAARRAFQAVEYHLSLQTALLSGVKLHLGALSPFAVLSRGYAIVTREDEAALVKQVSDVAPGDKLRVRVSDGVFGAQVTQPDE